MASLDPRYRLAAVITARSGGYRVGRDILETYLILKGPIVVSAASLHRSGRGIAYTRSPCADVLERSAG